MTALSYLYRFASNAAFLSVSYVALNYLTQYSERILVAYLILLCCAMRIVSVICQLVFLQKVKLLEIEAGAFVGTCPARRATRNRAIRSATVSRQQSEWKAYIDLVFLVLISLLCVVRISA